MPNLNIGNRQKSRLKPRNVVDVNANKKQIIRKIYNGLNNNKFYENPYKLSRKFKKIPNEILKKFLSNNLKLKKCTI